MKRLRGFLDTLHPHFVGEGRLRKLYPLYEALDTFLYTPGDVTREATHVRDAMDMKRIMGMVVVALIPCIYMAMWNTGFQANLALEQLGRAEIAGWRGSVMGALGIGVASASWVSNVVHGSLYFLPVLLVCYTMGGLWETLFAVVRRHEINEGFLVTGILFPLTLPPTIPLWQVALGISFGVVLGKEIYGGTGKNFLNPALTARAFLYFAYPVENSGNQVWVAVDGLSAATPLGVLAADGMSAITPSWAQAFWGSIPGSFGETSAFACLLGALLLVLTGVGSWRIMVSMLLGAVAVSGLLYSVGSPTNLAFQMPPHWHLVTGGFAFGLVFMATDPVSAAMTNTGRWIYGALCGVLTIIIRVVNPAFPEGVMLAILFGNVMAPLIDFFVVRANVNRRLRRTAAAAGAGA